MEEIAMNAVTILTSYGALGACCIYFMWKDSTVNKKLTETLNELTVAIETLLKLEGGRDEH